MRSLLNVPAEVVSANINAAVAKAAAKKRRIFVLGIMAGAFIAMGAQSSSLAVHNITDVGIARTLAGCIFPVGLMMIVFVGGELFTGDCMMSERPYWLWKPFKNPFDRLSGEFCRSGADRLSGGSQRPV